MFSRPWAEPYRAEAARARDPTWVTDRIVVIVLVTGDGGLGA